MVVLTAAVAAREADAAPAPPPNTDHPSHGLLLRQPSNPGPQAEQDSSERTSDVIPRWNRVYKNAGFFKEGRHLSTQLSLVLGTDSHLSPIRGNTLSRVPEVKWEGTRGEPT